MSTHSITVLFEPSYSLVELSPSHLCFLLSARIFQKTLLLCHNTIARLVTPTVASVWVHLLLLAYDGNRFGSRSLWSTFHATERQQQHDTGANLYTRKSMQLTLGALEFFHQTYYHFHSGFVKAHTKTNVRLKCCSITRN